MIRYLKKYIMFFVVMLAIVFGADVVFAQGLVQCTDNCGFYDLIRLAENIIRFLIVIVAPIAAIAFAYAGFLMFTSRGNEQQVTKAKEVFWYVLIGIVVVLGAFLMIKILKDTLIDPSIDTFIE